MQSTRRFLCLTLTLFLTIVFIQTIHAYVQPYPGNCQMYQECDASGCFIKQCGAGTEFNPHVLTCDYPLAGRTDCTNRS